MSATAATAPPATRTETSGRGRRTVPESIVLTLAALLALAAFALAYLSPVDHSASDPAIALLASQTLIDHGTLRLDVYLDDPAIAYDLTDDYRIRLRDGSYRYHALGVPLLSLPAVWLAGQAGWDMRVPEHERALQNRLSAAVCAVLAILLYALCRAYLGPWPSLALTAITFFGSSLISTLATGLWNAGYAVVLLALALVRLARAEADPAVRPRWFLLTLLAAAAFLCRPTAAFAIAAAVAAYLPPWLWARVPAGLRGWPRPRLALAGAVALALALLLVAGMFLLTAPGDDGDAAPSYYSPLKLTPRTPLLRGLHGVLLSPSRGLLVFSPFLLVVAAGAGRFLPALWRQRMFRLAVVWIALQVLAIATKGVWWGGHSFGPRLLLEVMLPALVIACLVWRELERGGRRRTRLLYAAAFLVTGLFAVYVHSYRGLFVATTSEWNSSPDVDRAPQLVFDWRYPQFLASPRSLEARWRALDRRPRTPYVLGEEVPFDAHAGTFYGWYPPEAGWRWSRGRAPELRLLLGDLPAYELFLFELEAGALGRQEIALAVNGTAAGSIVLEGHGRRRRAFAVGRELLRPGAENRFRFDVPGATATAGDDRVMAIALHGFALAPLDPAAIAGIGYDDDAFFAEGWSAAEAGWRWSDGTRAAIDYPVAALPSGSADASATLVLTAGALEAQIVTVRIGGTPIGELAFPAGIAPPVSRRLVFDPALLRPGRMNRIELLIPSARPTADDPRLLGLSFVRLELEMEAEKTNDTAPSRTESVY